MTARPHTTMRRHLPMVLLIAAATVWLGVVTPAQQQARVTITGRVTADRGEVRAFRVAAHNLDQRIWYVVFTRNGTYTVPQALPGRYELTVW